MIVCKHVHVAQLQTLSSVFRLAPSKNKLKDSSMRIFFTIKKTFNKHDLQFNESWLYLWRTSSKSRNALSYHSNKKYLTRDGKFPELLVRVVVEVVVEKEEGGQGLPVMWRPLMQTAWCFIAMHVDLSKSKRFKNRNHKLHFYKKRILAPDYELQTRRPI